MSAPTRREFLKHVVSVGALSIGASAVLTACGKKEGGGAEKASGCMDTTGLAEGDIKMRESNAYVDVSPNKDKNCENCALYKPAAAGAACGGCNVLKGPIAPKGYCNLWAKKAG